MLDINYYSIVKRNAPEADIPIHNILEMNYILGGASNVAYNLNQLETKIELISVIGNDENGKKIKDILEEKKINNKLFIDSIRKTTQKHRIINNNNIKVRFDIEDTENISTQIADDILYYIKNKNNLNAIIISDYDKGVISEYLSTNLINYANMNNIYTFVDPKVKNYNKYKNCFLLKPNFHEAVTITKNNKIKEIFQDLKILLSCSNILLTHGQKGMYLNNEDQHICHEKKIEVMDVTGAGDLVIAVFVYIFLKEKNLLLASKISNFIAGKSVTKIGNYIVSREDINEYFFLHNKIIYENETEKINQLSKNQNIVFTNGCFDIIHSGHVKLLQFAKKQGDILILGLNSDQSIKNIKGENRPINDINERCDLLLNLNIIDYIIIFESNNPFEILKHLKPKKIIKGGDYTKDKIIGGEFCEQIILFDYIENKSTSLIVNKIKSFS